MKVPKIAEDEAVVNLVNLMSVQLRTSDEGNLTNPLLIDSASIKKTIN